MRVGANACRVTNAAALFSGGVFPGGLRRNRFSRGVVGTLAYFGECLAINASCTAASGSDHGLGHRFRRDGAIGLARAREQWIDERRQDLSGGFRQAERLALA